MEKRHRSLMNSSSEFFLSSVTGLRSLSLSKSIRPTALRTLISSIPVSSPLASSLPKSLIDAISRLVNEIRDPIPGPTSPVSPPKKRPRRSSHRARPPHPNESLDGDPGKQALEKIRNLVSVVAVCVRSGCGPFSMNDFLPSVKLLHDNLVNFESDGGLCSEVVKLCEVWWKKGFPEREGVISQFLPYLLSRSLISKKKVDVHRVYALRDAFSLFDYEDASIEDLKMLLMRCVISPVYLKVEEGRKFISFMFGLSQQVAKEALAVIRSQIPYGRKSILEAYGEILFRAWKDWKEDLRDEIEDGFLQGLIEGAIHANTRELAAAIRRVLGGFICQRTVDGVEKVLFRLAEPVLFRSLQVSNSNVRHNALHLLLDMFPLEDPDSTKETKDMLVERQFYLLERLLVDDCPDVRVVAVEGCCRILSLFWEIISSSIISKLISKIIDDMVHDIASDVRLSTVNGIIYLLDNERSHEILKVLLPRLRHLARDSVLSVRVAVVDLILLIRDIRTFQFNKVVPLEDLLSMLVDDQPQVAEKITRVLMPSYFPLRVNVEEACKRCVTLIKRSPVAGARFCEFAAGEGAPLKSLMGLFKVLINLVLFPENMTKDQVEGFLDCAMHLCKNLVSEPSSKFKLNEMFAKDKLKCLYAAAPSVHSKFSIFGIASMISPNCVSAIIEECIGLVTNCADIINNEMRQSEMRTAHRFLLSCHRFDYMFAAFAKVLEKASSHCGEKTCTAGPNVGSNVSLKRRRNKSSTHKERSVSSFEDDYSVTVGIAWQIIDLLENDELRPAFLSSSYLDRIIRTLKVISEISIVESVTCEYMSLTPVLAYALLALHIGASNPSKKKCRRSNISRSATQASDFLRLQTTYSEGIDHLVNCSLRLVRGRDQPASSTHPSDDGDVDKGRNVVQKVKMLTAVLKSVVDVVSVGSDGHNMQSFLNFASAFIQYIARGCSHSLDLVEDDMRDLILCIKSSFTYAAKLVNLILVDVSGNEVRPLILGSFHAVNQLLDLIACLESSMGSGIAGRVVGAAKSWLPDLVVGLGSPYLLNKVNDDISSTFSEIKQSFPFWPSVVARIELHELLKSNDSGDEEDHRDTKSKHLVFCKVMEIVVSLARVNRNVQDAFGMIFMAGTLLGLESDDFGSVLGLLRFLTLRLVGEEDVYWDRLDMMVSTLHELFPLIVNKLEGCRSEEVAKELVMARVVLEPVWTNRHRTGKSSWMEE